MDYQIFNDPFPYVIINDTFNSGELELIWREIDFLEPKLREPEGFFAAANETGDYITNSKGLSLDDTYGNRDCSDILTITRSIFFHNTELYDDLSKSSDYWVTWIKSNSDYTKLRKYSPGQGYNPHSDTWVNVLISTTLYKEEGSGGDLYFPYHDLTIETKNNQTVIFPGWVEHAVLDVEDNDRYAVTIFVHCASS